MQLLGGSGPIGTDQTAAAYAHHRRYYCWSSGTIHSQDQSHQQSHHQLQLQPQSQSQSQSELQAQLQQQSLHPVFARTLGRMPPIIPSSRNEAILRRSDAAVDNARAETHEKLGNQRHDSSHAAPTTRSITSIASVAAGSGTDQDADVARTVDAQTASPSPSRCCSCCSCSCFQNDSKRSTQFIGQWLWFQGGLYNPWASGRLQRWRSSLPTHSHSSFSRFSFRRSLSCKSFSSAFGQWQCLDSIRSGCRSTGQGGATVRLPAENARRAGPVHSAPVQLRSGSRFYRLQLDGQQRIFNQPRTTPRFRNGRLKSKILKRKGKI